MTLILPIFGERKKGKLYTLKKVDLSTLKEMVVLDGAESKNKVHVYAKNQVFAAHTMNMFGLIWLFHFH